MKGLFILGVILIHSSMCQYQYNYQLYPSHQGGNTQAGYHSHVGGHSIYGGTNTQTSQSMLDLILKSLISPTASPNDTFSSSGDFVNLWNTKFGYNLSSIGAIQENIGCRTRCLRLSESPVCGTNGTRYFNSCDAECDQVSYGTGNLRYNNKCCCDDTEVQLSMNTLSCYTVNSQQLMVVTQCMMKCLNMDAAGSPTSSGSWLTC